MITVTIKSEIPLIDPHFDVLHAACRDVAEKSGSLVKVVSEFIIIPPAIPQGVDPMEFGEALHEAFLGSEKPLVSQSTIDALRALDDEDAAQYVGSAPMDETKSAPVNGVEYSWDEAPDWATHVVWYGSRPAWANEYQFQHFFWTKGPLQFDGRVTLDGCEIIEARPAVKESLTTEPADPFAVDWSKAPAWANYHAYDSDGRGWFYQGVHEHVGDDGFHNRSSEFPAVASGFFMIVNDQNDWAQSLTTRPAIKATYSES